MILDDLTLYNFGLYADRQTITLTPPSPNKPVILLGGLNGAGKTTLLDALQLCLFGPHAKPSNRGSLAYSAYLSRCIHRRAASPEAAIEITFRHTVEGNEDQFKLTRSWRHANGSCNEQFEVLKNGRSESALADNWASQVEDFLPANIAHLFLFDGEQIEEYASQSDSSSLIGSAIQNLLGLDMVDQLDRDLQVYERRKRKEAKKEPVREDITAAEAELHKLRVRVDALKQDHASLRTHQIDRLRRRLTVVEEKYRKLGGELYERRTEIERCLTTAESVVDDGAARLCELATGSFPLLLVRSLLQAIEVRDHREEQSRQARELLEEIGKRDSATLRHLRSQSADESAISALKEYFDQDRAQRQTLGKKETALNLLPEVRSDLNALLRGGLDDLLFAAERCLKQQQIAETDVARIRTEYENVPTSDIIAETASIRASIKKEIVAFEAQYASMGQEVKRLEHHIVRKEQSLARLLETDAKEKGKRDDRTRILHHARKVRTTLSAFRDAVIKRHVRRIERLVLESYQQLLRKASLVTGLSIDPTRFSLTLFGRDNEVLNVGQLSAGERQLLAVALLWGLAKASGRPLPTAIDTPLGRLDSDHRVYLVERYLPFASHQTLLLSTDEEIAGEYLKRLRPWIGRSYYIAYDDEEGQSQLVPGYFNTLKVA